MPLYDDMFRGIESSEFHWQLGLTGSRARAMQMLVRAPQATALLSALRDDARAADEVANRVRDLAHHPDDNPQYTHPFDAAIAAYLRALDIVCPDLALTVCLLVHERCKNLWWAVPVVERILGARPTTEIFNLLEDAEPQGIDMRAFNKNSGNVVSTISSGTRRLVRASMKVAAGMAVGTTTLFMGDNPTTVEQTSPVVAVAEVTI